MPTSLKRRLTLCFENLSKENLHANSCGCQRWQEFSCETFSL